MRAGLLRTFALTISLSLTPIFAQQPPESFDKPLRETKIDLGPSDYLRPNTDAHVFLSCHYYSTFMVKELDDPGVKGADPVYRIIHPGQEPPCSRKPQPGERHFARWQGYFMGVKQNLIFLEAADGLNGAMEFQVFDPRTGAKIFHDQRYVPRQEDLSKLNFVATTKTSQITLRYQRAFFGKCSIPKHGLACWRTFQQQAGLTSAPMPACRANDYEGHDQGDDPSVIFYPVETTLLPQPRVTTTGSIDRCTPAD